MRRNGFISRTICGRKRRLRRDYKLNDYRAVSQGVQFSDSGSAQDWMKLAMIRIWQKKMELAETDERWAEVYPLLQIHDEFVHEQPKEIEDDVLKLMIYEMENVATLAVPVRAAGHTGASWLEAKG